MEQVIDLSRFISAHKHTYNDALSEIRNGKKKTHWMWFIFPQVIDKYFSGVPDHRTIEILDSGIFQN